MTQNVLPIATTGNNKSKVLTSAAGIVAVDWGEQGEMVLRFVSSMSEWGDPVCEVRIDLELAEKLARLLGDEVEDAVYR